MLFVVLVSAVVSGCVTQTHRQTSELQRKDGISRVVLMPLDVELAKLSAGGMEEPHAEWTEQAQRHMRAAMVEEAKTRNVELVDFDPERGTPEERDTGLDLVKLHRAVGGAIMVHQYLPGEQLPSKQGKFDWSLGPDAAAIARSQDADYALFLFVRDTYATAGRVAVIVVGALLGVGVPGGSQIGFASVVDLRTGDIVWFNRLVRPTGDLRTPAAAVETVKVLVIDAMK